ncbi:hypothetical protein V1508DRAFT_412540 [Lipomyces doorenjongii]|uniref:uncharacterized protein n=1 Tax=Lipomyces doorenjongii TaxID=383834 RepID=UPI0034CE561C
MTGVRFSYRSVKFYLLFAYFSLNLNCSVDGSLHYCEGKSTRHKAVVRVMHGVKTSDILESNLFFMQIPSYKPYVP